MIKIAVVSLNVSHYNYGSYVFDEIDDNRIDGNGQRLSLSRAINMSIQCMAYDNR